MSDITLRLFKNMKKIILPKFVLSMLHVGHREKTNSVPTFS